MTEPVGPHCPALPPSAAGPADMSRCNTVPGNRGQTLHFLQALRAIAAWMVIGDHALLEVSRNVVASPLTHVAWTLGSLGVYVFFAISGFIMVHISWNMFGRPDATVRFLKRRLIRIVPLYWLGTVAALAYHKVSWTHGAGDGWRELMRSMLFIPYAGSEASWTPVLPQGWTLNYEVMFYAVFGIGLSFSRRAALPGIAVLLGLIVMSGTLTLSPALTFLSSPIVLLFVVGMGLAVLWRSLALAEPAWLASSARQLERFGDASYSTYLCHGFVLTVLFRVLTREGLDEAVWTVSLSLAAATAAGLVTHKYVEQPVLRRLSGGNGSGRHEQAFFFEKKKQKTFVRAVADSNG